MAWRREQRENERLVQLYLAVASVEADQARIARVKFEQARALVHDAQGAFADAPRSARVQQTPAAPARPRPRARGRAPHRAVLAQVVLALAARPRAGVQGSRRGAEGADRRRLAAAPGCGPYLGRRTGMRTLRSPGLRGMSAWEGGS